MWLRGEITARGFSNRELGRLIDPEDPKRGRRRVLRHLSGQHFPSAASRAVYLKVFGLDDDPFEDDDEAWRQQLIRDARALLATAQGRSRGSRVRVAS